MTKLVYIVYVHPVELGEPNLHKVVTEWEFADKRYADQWIETYNKQFDADYTVAVYYGCVNDQTGELV